MHPIHPVAMPEHGIGSKRSNYSTESDWEGENNNNTQKKPRQEGETKVRMLVFGRYSGMLIGKGGENFKRLREQYPVKIHGLNSQANERLVQLDGPVEHCLSVVRELLPLCPQAPYSASRGKSSFGLNILSNTGEVGALIGKAGCKMREVTDATGIHLKVYPDCLPGSNERVVAIGAEDEDTAIKGLEKVLEILDGAFKNNPTIYFNPEKSESVLGFNGQHNNNPSSGAPAAPQIVAPDAMPGAVVAENINNVPGMLIAHRERKQKLGIDPAIDFGSMQTMTMIKVPYELSGVIIGKGGQNVRYMKSVSGANIEFSSVEGNEQFNTERTITVKGTQEQIQIAEQLMAQCVRVSSPQVNQQQQQQQLPPWLGYQ